MSTSSVPPPPPPPLPLAQPTKRGSLVAILVTLACGAFLAVGSCFGALFTMNTSRQSAINTIFGYGVVAGVALFVFGIVWAIMAAIISVINRARR